VPIGTALDLVIPISIKLEGGKITTTFDNKTSHTIFYEAGVEIFTREIEKDGGDVKTETKQKTIRVRKDTK
jgi:hypothetical protein